MTDKEHDGVEKEMNMPDTEAQEGGTQTIGAGSGEGMTNSKPEQKISDAEKSEGQIKTIETDLGEGMANDSGMQTTDTEGSKSAAQTNGTGEGKDGSKTEPKEKTSSFQDWAQMIASLAAVLTAVIALLTMCEMKSERDIAYSPEIVVSPNAFEGGKISAEEEALNGKYFYINYQTNNYNSCYSEEPKGYPDCLYLEIPYLTLKNIGQGTAKDIEVIFPMDWIDSVAAELSEVENADYSISRTKSESGTQEISLQRSESGKTSKMFLSNEDDLVKKITYIATDETSVNVALPECWIKMLGVLYGRTIREKTSGGQCDYLNKDIDIPDPVIHFKYSDMQGKSKEDDIDVPWTGYCTYYRSSYILDSDDEESTQLRTGFYEDYIE